MERIKVVAKRNLAGFVVLLSLIWPALAGAAEWWHDDWRYYKELQVDISGLAENGGTDSVPVLLKLSGGNFRFFGDVLPRGEDLRFVAADQQTVLKHHLEKFDPITEIALVWVQVKKTGLAVSTGPVTTETVYMYYGNPTGLAAEDGAGTYGVEQSVVYHFDTPASPRDVTAYQNHPTVFSGAHDARGLVGGAGRFTADSALQLPQTPSLLYRAADGMTVSLWMLADDVETTGNLLSLGAGEDSLVVSVRGNGLAVTTAQGQEQALEGVLQSGIWQLLTLSLGAEQANLYLNGKVVATVPGLASDTPLAITVGASGEASGFVGAIDEMRVATTQRPGSWIKRHYDNLAIGSDIVIYGADESAESSSAGDQSYFSGILSNVSTDGWAVIFTLGLMAAASLVVVLGKVLMLSGVKRDNNKFMRDFRAMTDELTALDREETDEDREMQDSPFLGAVFGRHDHYQSSNLYQLYHVGMQELSARLGAGSEVLSPQNIAAARAALDATFVRQQQRLNKSMVMLTIAISGGPFLGLLGTVLGVMITFAEIARSGDVNINAIAPGVSAALMTTVAGLAVAIPALFSYNYLSTRIRDLTIDMRVFADELLARIAEYHS